MVIKHTVSWKQLDYLNDSSLLPALKDKGMPVALIHSLNGVKIVPEYGRFYWEDNGMYRTFIWEGNIKLPDEEVKEKFAQLKAQREAEVKPKKSHVDPVIPSRSIDFNHED